MKFRGKIIIKVRSPLQLSARFSDSLPHYISLSNVNELKHSDFQNAEAERSRGAVIQTLHRWEEGCRHNQDLFKRLHTASGLGLVAFVDRLHCLTVGYAGVDCQKLHCSKIQTQNRRSNECCSCSFDSIEDLLHHGRRKYASVAMQANERIQRLLASPTNLKDLYTKSQQTLQGSFSAVSKPIFANTIHSFAQLSNLNFCPRFISILLGNVLLN